MPDMREGGLGTATCYLTVERLALQAGVESPFWDEALAAHGCEGHTRMGEVHAHHRGGGPVLPHRRGQVAPPCLGDAAA